jgi:hypothetical protein
MNEVPYLASAGDVRQGRATPTLVAATQAALASEGYRSEVQERISTETHYGIKSVTDAHITAALQDV